MALSPLTARRLANFKANKRGYWSLWLFAVLFILTLFAEFLVTPGAVTASQQTAQQLGVSVGDTFELLVDGKTQQARLLATLPDDGTGSLDRLLVTDIATAQEIGVQGVHRAGLVDGAIGGDQGLPEHLPAKHLGRTYIVARANVYIVASLVEA